MIVMEVVEAKEILINVSNLDRIKTIPFNFLIVPVSPSVKLA